MGDVEDVEVERAAVDLLRRRVLNVVGHELRTPITTIRGLAESLGTTGDPEAELAVHDALRRTARRTEALLDDLLLATGVSTALPVGDVQARHVAPAVRATWERLDPGGEVAVAGDGVVLAVDGALERVLLAVLDNAAKYGEPPVEVRVTTLGAEVQVVVSDRGPGVPAAELALVTEPFFRGERAVLGHHSLGLGLAVVRSLVEHLDGAIEVRNRDGGGFEVELRLPSVA